MNNRVHVQQLQDEPNAKPFKSLPKPSVVRAPRLRAFASRTVAKSHDELRNSVPASAQGGGSGAMHEDESLESRERGSGAHAWWDHKTARPTAQVRSAERIIGEPKSPTAQYTSGPV